MTEKTMAPMMGPTNVPCPPPMTIITRFTLKKNPNTLGSIKLT